MISLVKAAPAGDVVDALLECHARIRSFSALALRLSRAGELAEGEARDAAAAVHRYFAQALPLHARDEEDSILPRLRGREQALDAALEAMQREHGEHGPVVARVLAACAAVAERPAELPRVASALEAAAVELERHFAVHLDAEERLVFPALRAHLPREVHQAVLAEMRARRG